MRERSSGFAISRETSRQAWREYTRFMVRTVVFLFVTSCCAFAQPAGGELKGVVLAPDGLPVPLASVQVSGGQSGTTRKTISSEKGEYTLGDLPPGTYDLAVVSIRYLDHYAKKGVVVRGGESLREDVRLSYVKLGGTAGEGHEAALSSVRRTAPRGPAPRMPDGKPDFSGVWSWPNPTDQGNPIFLSAGLPNGSLIPATYCLPHAVLWYNQYLKLVQTPALIVLLFDDDDPAYRQIYLDGRAHPKNDDPTWYGHSVGHWEGDTLVVDRVGFNGRGWLDPDGHRYTEALHVTDRYRRPDLGHLEMVTTLEDPAVLKAPWMVTRISILAPDEDVREYPCNENNVDPAHMAK